MTDQDRRVLASRLEALAQRIARSPVQAEDAGTVQEAAREIRARINETARRVA